MSKWSDISYENKLDLCETLENTANQWKSLESDPRVVRLGNDLQSLIDYVKPKPKPLTVYYFGCVRSAGHRLFDRNGSVNPYKIELPFKWTELDGGFCFDGPQKQGVAKITSVDGWTIMAFWDRSVDSRENSNSAFVAKGEFDFDQMCQIAEETFPNIWKRITNKFVVILGN